MIRIFDSYFPGFLRTINLKKNDILVKDKVDNRGC